MNSGIEVALKAISRVAKSVVDPFLLLTIFRLKGQAVFGKVVRKRSIQRSP